MRYSSKGRPFRGEVPPVHDPRWVEWTKSLLAFLDKPRTWKDLKRWAAANKIDGHFLRHQLAWLEDKKLAASKPPKERKGPWVWFNARAAKSKPAKRKSVPTTRRLAQKVLRKTTRSMKKKIGVKS